MAYSTPPPPPPPPNPYQQTPYQPPPYHPQQSYQPPAANNAGTGALVTELIFGLLGALGMGWFYAGSYLRAIVSFIGYIILVLFESIIIGISGGICACIVVPFNILLIILSATQVQKHCRNTGAQGSVLRLLIAIGLLIIVGVGLGLFFGLGLAALLAILPELSEF